MNLLPKWVLPPTLPSVYDCESFTALEMVSKLYGAVNELINEYNKTVEQLNGFQDEEKAAREKFETDLTKVIREFMCEMRNGAGETTKKMVKEMIDNGEIVVNDTVVNVEYDATTEAMNIVVSGGIDNA